MKPALLVIAGPNGAGKTTVTARLRDERWSEGVEYLNPDEIARDRFGDWNSPAAVLSAATWTTQRREELLAARAGIAFETVLHLSPAIALADRVSIYDNSVEGVEARLCARTQDGLPRKIHGPIPEWIADAVLTVPGHQDFVDLRAA